MSATNGNVDLAARMQAHQDARDTLFALIDQAVTDAANELEFERASRPDLPEEPPIAYEPKSGTAAADSIEPTT